jgi:hypothetical protein
VEKAKTTELWKGEHIFPQKGELQPEEKIAATKWSMIG